MIIERFVNKILESNCYLVIHHISKKVIVIDPGDNQLTDLIKNLEINDLIVEYVIFTHEHYDHIAGGAILKQKFDCKFIGSEECAEAIINPKRNLSVFYDDKPYVSPKIDITVEQLNCALVWNSLEIKFLKTPGHSVGSICVFLDKYIFTGDTLIKDTIAITKLPGGSKVSLQKSLSLIKENCDINTIVLPGHKEMFSYGIV